VECAIVALRVFASMESIEKDVPAAIRHFYEKFEYVSTSTEDKVKLVSHCKKCKKSISVNWKPNRVTSILISHVKVCHVAYLSNVLLLVLYAIVVRVLNTTTHRQKYLRSERDLIRHRRLTVESSNH